MKIRSGIDSVYIPRIKAIVEGDHFMSFLNKSCSEKETEYILSHRSDEKKAESLAGRFAAKEAVSKALGTGILAENIALPDIEILTDDNGAPYPVFRGKAHKITESLKVCSASVSITHEREYASAVCVLLCNEEI